MNERAPLSRGDPVRVLREAAVRVAILGVNGLRLAVFSVLALLEPVILVALTIIVVVLIAMCGFYALVHPGHFPFGMVAGLIVLCGIAALAYYALMHLLLPGTRGASGHDR
jgi:hypothetical protein